MSEDFAERYRLAQVDWAQAEGEALRLDEMKKIVFSELVNQSDEKTAARAEHWARCHPRYREAVQGAVEAKTRANLRWAEVKSMEMRFERWRTQSATKRAEMTLR